MMQCLLPVSHELPHEHGGGTRCREAQVKLGKSFQAHRSLKVSKKATDVAQGADRNQVLLQMLDEARPRVWCIRRVEKPCRAVF